MKSQKLITNIVIWILLCILVVLLTIRITATPKEEAILEAVITSWTLTTDLFQTGMSVVVEEPIKPEALAVVNDGNNITFTRDSNLNINVKFTQHFIDTYKYEDSRNFCFALNVKQNGKGGYYDTYRNENGGVSNDSKRNLSGCVPAYKFVDGVDFIIPLNTELSVANDTTYGYNNMEFLPGNFSIYMSPVKETSWINIFDVVVK